MSKIKLGDTVWVKAVVTEVKYSGFEIGFGFHSQNYNYDTLAVYTKEEALKELQKPETPKVGEAWIYFKDKRWDQYKKKVIAVTDHNVFLETGDNPIGEAYDLQDFLRTHVRVSETQTKSLTKLQK